MVAPILFEACEPPSGEPALSPEARDQAQLFERAEVGESGRGSYTETGGDLLEARASRVALPRGDDPKRLDLPMGKLLEGLHVVGEKSAVYIRHSNN